MKPSPRIILPSIYPFVFLRLLINFCINMNMLQGARTIAITYSNSLFTRTTCEAAKVFAIEQASIPYKIG